MTSNGIDTLESSSRSSYDVYFSTYADMLKPDLGSCFGGSMLPLTSMCTSVSSIVTIKLVYELIRKFSAIISFVACLATNPDSFFDDFSCSFVYVRKT